MGSNSAGSTVPLWVLLVSIFGSMLLTAIGAIALFKRHKPRVAPAVADSTATMPSAIFNAPSTVTPAEAAATTSKSIDIFAAY
jgi:hypothetical protein